MARISLARVNASCRAPALAVPLLHPNPQPKTATGPQLDLDLWGPSATSASRRKPWAWLLKHVFAEDLAACERCGGPTRWLEVATTPEHIAALLTRHGLGPPPRSPAPPRRPSRGQLELVFV